MKSINHHSPPLATHKHHSVSRNGRHDGILRTHNIYLSKTVRTKSRAAITSSHLVVLAVNSPPATTGDLSVLIPTRFPSFLRMRICVCVSSLMSNIFLYGFLSQIRYRLLMHYIIYVAYMKLSIWIG